MCFYTGLIKFLDNEAQLAGVMAHEIAHADRRHSTDRLTKAYGLQSKSQYGFVAQELEQVFPELVTEVMHPKNNDPKMKDEANQDAESYKGVKYIEMIPPAGMSTSYAGFILMLL